MCPLSPFTRINGDVSAFGTKGRRALITYNSYYTTNQRHAPRSACLALVTKGRVSAFYINWDASQKHSSRFYPPRFRPAVRDVGTSYFTRSEMTGYGRIYDPCLLLEFFYWVKDWVQRRLLPYIVPNIKHLCPWKLIFWEWRGVIIVESM
jgi:hypothetical protein